MPFSRVILKQNNKLNISKRKYVGGKLHYQQKDFNMSNNKTPDIVHQISKQISEINLNRRKPITLKL
jgi:hypothetical protein